MSKRTSKVVFEDTYTMSYLGPTMVFGIVVKRFNRADRRSMRADGTYERESGYMSFIDGQAYAETLDLSDDGYFRVLERAIDRAHENYHVRVDEIGG